MTKSRFRYVGVTVESKDRKIKILETPTLLKELYLTHQIEFEEYSKRLTTYNDVINSKYKSVESPINNSEKKTLRPYQQTIVDFGSNFKSFAVFDEPRLGKTPAILKLLEKKELLKDKIYIASPGKVTGNWIKEIEDWLGLKAEIYKGGTIPKDVNILVSTYERVSLSLKDILKWKPKVFVLDEAHVLRNSKGSRQRLTKKQQERRDETGILPVNHSILKLAKKVEHRYPLTGTPTVNTPEDIFAILQFLMPNTYDSFWTFAYYYFDIGFNFMGGREILRYKQNKEKELQELLDYCSTQHKQVEQMKWLKQPTITTMPIALNRFQQELEEDLIENATIGETLILNTLEHFTHYNSIVINPSVLEMIETDNIGAKNSFILKELEENPKENVAIFSTREKNLNSLEKHIRKRFPERKIYTLKGSSSSNSSIEIQNKINSKTKKEGIIFLGTVGTSKEGISLQGLSKAYVTDQSWTPSDMTQLFNRLNATTPENQEYFGEKEIIILQTPNTIDTVIQEALDTKKELTDILNDYKKFIKKRKGE